MHAVAALADTLVLAYRNNILFAQGQELSVLWVS